MSIADDIEAFRVQYQVFHGLSDGPPRSWARQQRERIADFASFVGKPREQWTGEDFARYLSAHIAAERHVNTVRKYGNQLRSFFSWCYATGRLTADQYLQLKSVGNPRGATARSTPKPYTQDELAAFWVALDERLPRMENWDRMLRRWLVGRSRWRKLWRHALRLEIEAIVALALHCGLRADEIYNLTPDAAHYDNEYVVVTGKGGRTRAVPYTETARVIVQRWIELRAMMRPETGALWLSCYGSAWNLPMSRQRFEVLVQDAVGPWPLHRFRHTYATERLRAGVPLEIVSRALGHASTSQTLAYAEIVRGDIAHHMAATEQAFVKAVMSREAA